MPQTIRIKCPAAMLAHRLARQQRQRQRRRQELAEALGLLCGLVAAIGFLLVWAWIATETR